MESSHKIYFSEQFQCGLLLRRVIFCRSIRLQMFHKIKILKFPKIHRSSDGVSWPKAYNLLNEETPAQIFSSDFAKVLRAPFDRTLSDDCFYSEKSHFLWLFQMILLSTEKYQAFVWTISIWYSAISHKQKGLPNG